MYIYIYIHTLYAIRCNRSLSTNCLCPLVTCDPKKLYS